ncbi:MAG: hypothetical protein FJW40_10435 [Acidobacteria bacterium]|nr:hypothetical protein [Acidobacteriota bacterium]
MKLIAISLLAASALPGAPRRETVYKQTPQGELKIHLFFPEEWTRSDRRPAIVFFFGGGFVGGTPAQFFSKAGYFASRGLVAASAEYRVRNRHQTDPTASVEDCKSAIRWVRSNAGDLGVDAGRIIGGGGSAGATCVLAAALNKTLDSPKEDAGVSSRPDALVLYNPALEFQEDRVKALFAGDAVKARSMDPSALIAAGAPPMILIYGSNDPMMAEARRFMAKSRGLGNRPAMYTAKGQGHGFFNDRADDPAWHPSVLYVSDAFLAGQKYLAGQPTIPMPVGSRAALYAEMPPPPAGPGPREIPGVRVTRNIVQAKTPEKDLLIDLYLPAQAAAKPLPLIVWVHGGAWRAGNKENPLGLWMVERGYALASVNYRLSHEAIFPAQIHDTKAAIRWLRANAAGHGLDAGRIGVFGSSAGGHLVALLGTSGDVSDLEGTVGTTGVSSRVQAVVDFFGPTTLTRMSYYASRMDHNAPDSPESMLVGGPVQQNPDLVRRADPISYITPGDPPFLIFHGDHDPLVPPEQSELLAAALKKANVPVSIRILPGAGHGGKEFSAPDVLRQIEQFFDKHLKGI